MTYSTKTLMLGLLVTPLLFGGACKGDDTAEEAGTETETGTTGDGDGDGDTVGDGDGEPAGDGDGEPVGDGDGEPVGDGDGEPGDPIVYAENPAADYDRVDRMGMPAINTAVIVSKDDYNAANPTDDANNLFVGEIAASVTNLHVALDDDLVGAMLVPCVPNMCLAQASPLIVPDTLKIDLDMDPGFPNGRALADPVMDVTLAVILLNLGAPDQDALTLVGTNPTANDVEFSDAFPYLAPPH